MISQRMDSAPGDTLPEKQPCWEGGGAGRLAFAIWEHFQGTPNVVYFLIFLQNIKNRSSGLFQRDNASDSFELCIDLRHCKDRFLQHN